MPILHKLQQHLRHCEVTVTDSSLRIGINAAQAKLNRYYRMLYQSKTYILATVLDPRRNLRFFKYAFENQPEVIEYAVKVVADTFTLYRKRLRLKGKKSSQSEFSLDSWPHEDPALTRQVKDDEEYLSYVRSYPVGVELDLRKFWKEKTDIWDVWPNIAFDSVFIPAMSSEVERVFSRYHPDG